MILKGKLHRPIDIFLSSYVKNPILRLIMKKGFFCNKRKIFFTVHKIKKICTCKEAMKGTF